MQESNGILHKRISMSKKSVVLIVCIALILGCTEYVVAKWFFNRQNGIPIKLERLYQEKEKVWEQSYRQLDKTIYGSTFRPIPLFVCTKGTSKVYEIVTGSGFNGTKYYYDEQGNPLGISEWNDIQYGNTPRDKYPVDIWNYDCLKAR